MNDNQNNQSNQNTSGNWWENEQNKSTKSGNWWEGGQSNSQGNGTQWENRQNGAGNTWWDQTNVNFPPFFTNAQQEEAKRKATTSMILGIIGLLLSLMVTPLAGIILGIIAVVKSNTAKKLSPTPFGEAKAGKILGILAIIFGALPFVIFLMILSITLFLALIAIIFG